MSDAKSEAAALRRELRRTREESANAVRAAREEAVQSVQSELSGHRDRRKENAHALISDSHPSGIRRGASQSEATAQPSVDVDFGLKLARDWRAEGYFVSDRPGLMTREEAASVHAAVVGAKTSEDQSVLGW